MGAVDLLFEALQLVLREASLFAAVGFLFLGVGDLLIDLAWLMLAVRRAFRPNGAARVAGDLPPPAEPGRFAIFVPAWDEADVIGGMLRHAIEAFGEADYLIYVGCYPNDPATIAAVRRIADPRVRLVVGPGAGPTSKADCLNRLWERMTADEAAEGFSFKAVVLHDAEDVVHSAELRLFDSLIERFDLVQLPVVPLVDRKSRWIAGHYLDEFAEAHGKEMVVRAAMGVGLPSAGVGCAIARAALAAIAGQRGEPFDTDSLTEDYELGLRLRAAGRSATFVRLPAAPGRALVATKGYFPTTLHEAIAQKARWVAGIALSGWDRLGWSGGLAERWMRLRDRQSVIAAFLLAVAYLASLCGALVLTISLATGREMRPFSETFILLAAIATALLLWRLLVRFFFVARAHGWREAWRSPFRAFLGNAIAILAAARALDRYQSRRRTGQAIWDKTAHAFPARVPAE